jgi:agarase
MRIKQLAVFGLIACLNAGWCYSAARFGVRADAKGKYWFVDPQGKQFLSIGINDIVPLPFRPRPDSRYYNPVANQFNGDFDAWKKDVFNILQETGFNTLGAWSDGRLYDGPIYGTVCLYVAGHEQTRCLEGLRPGFEERIQSNAKIILDTYPYLDNVFGVYLDNEMAWYGHAAWGDIPNYTLLESALLLPKEDPARQAAVDFLKKRYTSADALSKAWGKPLSSWDEITFDYARSCVNKETLDARAAFIEFAADAFFKIACDTVRKMLPGKLILGTRFGGYAPEPVIRACGRYCDVVSFNNYRAIPSADTEMLARFWIWSGKKPMMITEYAWRAEENTSGNPNTGGAGAVVKTQAERAKNYSSYVEDLLSYPMVIGAHWFEFADQSPQGRFDGENSNYGIVDIHHRPYKEMLVAMKQTNDRIEKLHAESDRQAPQSLPKPKAVVFEPGQRPERPPFIDILNAIPAGEPELYHAPDARIDLKKEADHLAISFDTGKDWGCGVSFYGPKEFANASGPAHSANMDGYSAIELDAVIGTNIVFDIFLDEAGIGAPDAVDYDVSGGDDAEGFLIPSIQGKQQRSVYRLELKNLEARTNWGNQKGLRKVDIHSIKGMSLFFHGGQGKNQIRVYSLKWVR